MIFDSVRSMDPVVSTNKLDCFVSIKGSHAWIRARKARADSATVTTRFDAFVTILIQLGEVFPQFSIGSMHDIAICCRGKLRGESSNSSRMKLVLVRLW